MKRASLEQRKTTASAMSPTSPNRPLDDRGDGGADVRCEACGDNVVGQLHAHISGDKPGMETVDPHAVTELARFHRGDTRHAVNSRFGAGVPSNGRECDRGRDRGDIDDGAAGTCTSARSHSAPMPRAPPVTRALRPARLFSPIVNSSLSDFIVVTRRCLPGGAAAGGRACCSSSADKKLSADRNERLDGAGVLPALPPRV